jgi:hypothetical protein
VPISWNEIKSRALTFSRTWADAANEDSQGKPFWIDFFEIFGITALSICSGRACCWWSKSRAAKIWMRR